MEIEPVAFFRSPFPTKFGIPRQSGLVPDLAGTIVFREGFNREEGIRGLEGFAYIWLIWGFSANPDGGTAAGTTPGTSVHREGETTGGRYGGSLLVRPPRLGGNRSVGVFASRSPFRPNGLGLSAVRLEAIGEGPVLHVRGADLLDGTPIYDIKPYLPYTDAHPQAAAGFTDSVPRNRLHVRFPRALQETFLEIRRSPLPAPACDAPDQPFGTEGRTEPRQEAGEALETLVAVLEQDPRPAYQQTPGRRYGLAFDGADIGFRVEGNTLTVTDVKEFSPEGDVSKSLSEPAQKEN